uniref:Putative secreted peptide n=1 Tax=Anopheles braziliensis TaxID=58242 RepID=A0A2M3ZPN7_9DIPT
MKWRLLLRLLLLLLLLLVVLARFQLTDIDQLGLRYRCLIVGHPHRGRQVGRAEKRGQRGGTELGQPTGWGVGSISASHDRNGTHALQLA